MATDDSAHTQIYTAAKESPQPGHTHRRPIRTPTPRPPVPLTSAERALLAALWAKPCRLSDLTHHLHRAHQTLSDHLRHLRQQGLVSRTPDPLAPTYPYYQLTHRGCRRLGRPPRPRLTGPALVLHAHPRLRQLLYALHAQPLPLGRLLARSGGDTTKLSPAWHTYLRTHRLVVWTPNPLHPQRPFLQLTPTGATLLHRRPIPLQTGLTLCLRQSRWLHPLLTLLAHQPTYPAAAARHLHCDPATLRYRLELLEHLGLAVVVPTADDIPRRLYYTLTPAGHAAIHPHATLPPALHPLQLTLRHDARLRRLLHFLSTCTPTSGEIATALQYSVQSVTKRLTLLQQLGWIRSQRDSQNHQTRYLLRAGSQRTTA